MKNSSLKKLVSNFLALTVLFVSINLAIPTKRSEAFVIGVLHNNHGLIIAGVAVFFILFPVGAILDGSDQSTLEEQLPFLADTPQLHKIKNMIKNMVDCKDYSMVEGHPDKINLHFTNDHLNQIKDIMYEGDYSEEEIHSTVNFFAMN